MAPNAAQSTERSIFGGASLRARNRSLVDLDPDLFAAVSPHELACVREIATHVVELEPGRWDPGLGAREAALGLLVLDGVMVRTVVLGEPVATELVGAGDLIRPWEASGDEGSVLPCVAGWEALAPTRLALLGRRLALAAADCPGIVTALLDRSGRRGRSQGILTAIAHLKRIEVRVLVLLWHLAERAGRVTGAGVVVPLGLTHQRLADLVGAQRPSVTAALSRMSARGLVERTPDRGYLLTHDARAQVDALCRGGERAFPPLEAVCA